MNKRPCKTCAHHWKWGIKDGKHNDWCCWKGAPAKQSIGHCKLHGGYKQREVK